MKINLNTFGNKVARATVGGFSVCSAVQAASAQDARKPLQHHMCSPKCECVHERYQYAPKSMTRAQFLSRDVR